MGHCMGLLPCRLQQISLSKDAVIPGVPELKHTRFFEMLLLTPDNAGSRRELLHVLQSWLP